MTNPAHLAEQQSVPFDDLRRSSMGADETATGPSTSKFQSAPDAKARGMALPRAKSAITLGSTTTTSSASAQALTNISTPTIAPAISTRSKQRPFRSINPNNTRQWVTREIAALEFLQMGIPMAREGEIVHEGWKRQHPEHTAERSTNWLDQSIQLNTENIKEEIASSEEQKAENDDDDDGILPISPALLPLERSYTSSDPALVKQGRWWEKWITGQNNPAANQRPQQDHAKNVNVSRDSQIEDLEEPGEQQQSQRTTATPQHLQQKQPTLHTAATIHAPGRRLEGDTATKVQIPLANTLQNSQGSPGLGMNPGQKHQRQNSDVVSLQLTKQQTIARMAISKEWELRVAHGLDHHQHDHHLQQHHQQQHRQQNPPLLDGRMYMSAKESYPIMVFSLLRYEPKKEEALRRRKKLEERGGGGTQFFIMPSRDWRGISFRALLPVKMYKDEDSPPKFDGINDTEKTGNGRSSANKSRLLFDRFASKKVESKDNLIDADTKEDGTPRDRSSDEGESEDDDVDITFDTDDDEEFVDDTYVAGLLDDPAMVLGCHRNVMIGDRGTGPIVSSTIQFVKPKLLKADLNKQFRERFDGYEPPASQRKYIGAKVVDGMYTLMDPTQEKKVEEDDGSTSKKTEEDEDDTAETTTIGTSGTPGTNPRTHRKRQGSTSSMSISTIGGSTSIDEGAGEGTDTIRMPPSLTLSKIRSLKQQALAAAVRAKLEISTVALAIVYFERLCLDCRVDKSNRRLSFAACLLLAIKINEKHVGVLTTKAVSNPTSSKKSKATQRIQSLIRPSKKSSTMFASLLEFFTQEWNISLKHLFAAEWGVFAALQFRLRVKPSDVAFHFRRLMKTLGYDPRRYLGSQSYGHWQQALAEEEFRRQEWEARVEIRQEQKERKRLKQLQRTIEEAADRRGNNTSDDESMEDKSDREGAQAKDEEDTEMNIDEEPVSQSPIPNTTRRRLGIGDIFKSRLAGSSSTGGRAVSIERSWTRRRDSGEIKPGSADAVSSSIKNNPTAAAIVGTSKQRSRRQLLRPLSQSKSMLSLSENNGLDDLSESKQSLLGKNVMDEKPESKNSQVALGGLEEEGVRLVDDEEGIMI